MTNAPSCPTCVNPVLSNKTRILLCSYTAKIITSKTKNPNKKRAKRRNTFKIAWKNGNSVFAPPPISVKLSSVNNVTVLPERFNCSGTATSPNLETSPKRSISLNKSAKTYLRKGYEQLINNIILVFGYCCMFTFAFVMISVSLLRGAYKTIEERIRS